MGSCIQASFLQKSGSIEPLSACQKSLTEFAAADAKPMKSVFGRSMYVAENTSRPVSVEFICCEQTNYARGGAHPLRNSGEAAVSISSYSSPL